LQSLIVSVNFFVSDTYKLMTALHGPWALPSVLTE
jgi:hypothetical protein